LHELLERVIAIAGRRINRFRCEQALFRVQAQRPSGESGEAGKIAN